MRCGEYVSPECTLEFAPVQVRDTFGILLNRASLEVPELITPRSSVQIQPPQPMMLGT
jgi:hypothetical protein